MSAEQPTKANYSLRKGYPQNQHRSRRNKNPPPSKKIKSLATCPLTTQLIFQPYQKNLLFLRQPKNTVRNGSENFILASLEKPFQSLPQSNEYARSLRPTPKGF